MSNHYTQLEGQPASKLAVGILTETELREEHG